MNTLRVTRAVLSALVSVVIAIPASTVASTHKEPSGAVVMAQQGLNADTLMYRRLLMQANKGDVSAQTQLGLMRRDGQGVAKDLHLARVWLGKAAVANHAPAQYELGLLLLSDQLPQANSDQLRLLVEEGIGWLQRAAKQNYVPAQKELGKTYLSIPDKNDEGLELLDKASQANDLESTLLLSQWFLDVYAGASPQDKQAIAAAIVTYLTRAAEQNHAMSMTNLGTVYLDGVGTPPDPEQASQWYRKAVALSEPNAQFNLAILLLQNRIQPIESDPPVISLLTHAAEQGLLPAQKLLAQLFIEGRRVPQQVDQAVVWLEKAALQGDASSQFQLGMLKLQGVGTERNLGEAARWFEQSAQQKLPQAQYQYGLTLMMGLGTSSSTALAVEQMRASAAQGYEPAVQWLLQIDTPPKDSITPKAP